MSVTRAFYYLALPSQHHKIVHPLLRLLAVSPEVERVVLAYILSISHAAPVRPCSKFRAYQIVERFGSTCFPHTIPVLSFAPMIARKSRLRRRVSYGILSQLTIVRPCCASLSFVSFSSSNHSIADRLFRHPVGVQDYTDDVDETLVAGAIQGVGHIARTLPEVTSQCLNALMACIKSPHGRYLFPMPILPIRFLL